MGIFLIAARKYYGWKGFLFHQTIELLSFLTITASFLVWSFRGKKPFIRTSKKEEELNVKILLPYVIVIFLLFASIIKGIFYLFEVKTLQLQLAILINVFWAGYFLPFFIFGLYLVQKRYGKTDIKLLNKFTHV
jgi:cellulose synthase (UDP-forming)